MAEARAGVAAVIGTDVSAVGLTHSTTDAMNAGTLALDWRSGGRIVTTTSEHPGGLGPLYALRATGRGRRCSSMPARMATTRGPLAAFDAAITPGTRLVVAVARALDDRGRHAGRRHRRAGARSRRDGHRRRRAGGRRDPVPVRRPRRRSVRGSRPKNGCSGPEGMGALVVDPSALDRLVPALAGGFSFERGDSAGDAVWWPDARRFESSNYHRPSIVGMARSLGWLSMYVGSTTSTEPGWRGPRAMARRLAAIDGVTRPHAARPDGHPGHVPDRRLDGAGRARRARCPGLRDRPHDARASTRSGSASASSTPTKSSNGSPASSSCLRRIRPRRCRHDAVS